MSRKLIQYLSLAGTIALTIGTFSKPAVAGDAICDTSSSIPTLILDQQKPMRLNSDFFPGNALKQCQDAANLLRNSPNHTVLVAETLESGPVICVREDEVGGCGEDDALKLFDLKQHTNPQKALLDMLDVEDENGTQTFMRLFIPWRLLK